MTRRAADRLAKLSFLNRPLSVGPPSPSKSGTMLVYQTPSAPAPWRELFAEHIGDMQAPIFTLATLHPSSAASATSTSLAGLPPPPPPGVPRARTCVFRGLWGTLPHNDRNKAPRNPALYESDLPVFTTDARMDKMGELLGPGADDGLSGGGGPVEAVWWASRPGTQWRVRGEAWVLGPDIESDAPGAQRAQRAIFARMRVLAPSPASGEEEKEGEDDDDESAAARAKQWSWRREVTGHFGNLSPQMRGSFRNPPPGQPVAVSPGPGLGLGQLVDDLEDEVARKNFRAVVIVPTQVDQTDLSDPEHPRRWVYTYRRADGDTLRGSSPARQPGGEMLGDWEKVEVWP